MTERKKRHKHKKQGMRADYLMYTAGAVALAGLAWLGWRVNEEQVASQVNQEFVAGAIAMLGVDCVSMTQEKYAEVIHSRTFDPNFLTNTNLGVVVNERGERISMNFDKIGEPVMSGGSSRVEYPTPPRYSLADFTDGGYGIRVYGTADVAEEFRKLFLNEKPEIRKFLRGYFEGVGEGEMHINLLGGSVEASSINHPELTWLLDLRYQAAGQPYGVESVQIEGFLVQLNAMGMHNAAVAEGFGLTDKVVESLVNERVSMLARRIEPFSGRLVSEGASTAMGEVARIDDNCAKLGLNSDPDNPFLRTIAEVMQNLGR